MHKKGKFHKKLFIIIFCLAISIQALSPVFVFQCAAETETPVTDFTGLKDAIGKNTGAPIEIANDINLTAAIAVNKSITFKVAPGAEAVKLTAAGSRHFNVSGGDIALTFDGNVLIDGGKSAGGINSTANSLTLNNAVILDCAVAANGGGVFASRNATLNGCVFIGNSGGSGGGGAIWSSTDITVRDTSFSGNTAFVGAGVYAVGRADIYGSVFIGNTARAASGAEGGGSGSSGGGAVYARGSIIADSSVISGNTAGNGGGICSYQSTVNDTITIRNGTKIIGNQSLNPRGGGNGGGAIYSTNSRVIIQDGELSGNTAVSGGGAIYTDGGLIVTGGKISYNTTEANGGAARVYGSVMSVSGGEISGNTAGKAGGAILTGVSSATVSGTARIIGNTANGSGVSDGGGGFSLYNCTLTVSGGEISGNTASHANGGGIGDYLGSTVNITGGAITDNHAPEGDGGGIYIRDLTKITATSGALFSGNTASQAFWMTDTDDIALHDTNIHTDSRSAPPAGNMAFTYLFNNYDVNYTKGDTQNLLPLAPSADVGGTNRIQGKRRAYNFEEDRVYNYGYNYTTINEPPPPLASLPAENNPSTGRHEIVLWVALGILVLILFLPAIFVIIFPEHDS